MFIDLLTGRDAPAPSNDIIWAWLVTRPPKAGEAMNLRGRDKVTGFNSTARSPRLFKNQELVNRGRLAAFERTLCAVDEGSSAFRMTSPHTSLGGA
ncbi:hypothetical protein N7532_007786 [Penicillium argentinense]|uniref:Uncharacterized protein n=1 Tax=Penicillium argentinense TaxID=1131581 RepID=A0A9W9K1W6_9EURO|nr:uncharacterized protein N7532_007786 [Penicillium argentinense]KAJ5089102.1 hypothetical protein N7532_007786 [Penicillium argentinense]